MLINITMIPQMGKGLINMDKIPIIDNATKMFATIDKFNNDISYIAKVITSPVLIFKGLANMSYTVALVVGIAGIMLYLIGYKKGTKWTVGSIVGYTLIQAIGSAL
jgi:hypothetical protein